MDYKFEELLDAHFQMLCQSLLISEYPNVQCLPVGMADGGRDASSASFNGGDLVIFQVKFSRSSRSVKNPAKWMREAIDGEMEKIERLILEGATRYIIITNVEGTSQPGTGRIDQIQKYLDDKLPISGFCWWRDDIARRLDNNFDLKLQYPALLSGVDMLRLMLERTPNEARERRDRAIRAYLADQHGKDQKVRFKQANDLAGDLFKLFVDVPLGRRGHFSGSRHAGTMRRYVDDEAILGVVIDDHHVYDDWHLADEDDDLFYDPRFTGAAGALLQAMRTPGRRIVIEGAPGQGKSTLAQYLAEVQRVRLMNNKQHLVDQLPQTHAASPVLLPLKVELRDLALWFSGEDPWGNKRKPQPHQKACTLETALAAHIERHSGGTEFTVDDLLQLITGSQTLLILDALDEVADLDKRKRAVSEVMEGLERLDSNGAQVQVIVTSRPTAMEGAPAFPAESFDYFTLAPIPASLALNYAMRWGKARRLEEERITRIINVLQQRISAPHMAELAKNTMQLSILLTLIHLRGPSLPDQRTELYDRYVEVFMDREAEKTEAVSEIREPLMDIHRYLGFYLHAQAEQDGTNGKIFQEDLRRLIRDYLDKEKQPPELLNKLLTGSERVFVLVAKDEGTYEFEVQPLREYFAARHLWETAQYRSATRENPGGKPERFEGVAGNPYWMNVTRFFAGCFTKGELPGLAGQLRELIEEGGGRNSNYARTVAVALLQDWVFSKAPNAASVVVNSTFDEAGRVWASITARDSRLHPELGDVGVRLPEAAGDELVSLVWPDICLADDIATERLLGLCRLLRVQRKTSTLHERWHDELAHRHGDARETWFQLGSALGIFSQMRPTDLARIIESDGTSPDSLPLAICAADSESNRGMSTDHALILARAILEHPDISSAGQYPSSYLNLVPMVTSPILWSLMAAEKSDDDSDFLLYARHWLRHAEASEHKIPVLEDFVTGIMAELNTARGRRVGLRHIRATIDLLDEIFGQTWTSMELGVISGALRPSRSPSETIMAKGLFDADQPLPDRIRGARRRAGHAGWWRAQAAKADSPLDRCLWLLAVVAWADTQVVVELLPEFATHVAALQTRMQDKLVYAAARARAYSPYPTGAPLALNANDLLKADLGAAGYAALMARIPKAARVPILRNHAGSEMHGPAAASIFLNESVATHVAGALDHDEALGFAVACHAAGAGSWDLIKAVESKVTSDKAFGRDWAPRVLSDQSKYPDCYVRASYIWQKTNDPALETVMTVANREGWFKEPEP